MLWGRYYVILCALCWQNGASGPGNNHPYRGGKASVYEGGIRSPTFVWGKPLRNRKERPVVNGWVILGTPLILPEPYIYAFSHQLNSTQISKMFRDRYLVNLVITFWRRICLHKNIIFRHLELEIASANEWKIVLSNSAGYRLSGEIDPISDGHAKTYNEWLWSVNPLDQHYASKQNFPSLKIHSIS